MSDTLRTDLSQLSCAHMDDQEWGAAGWDHARQLERELAAARELAESNGKLAHNNMIEAMRYREELSEVRKDYNCLAERLNGHDATECRANLDKLIEQRDGAFSLIEYAGELLGVKPQEHKSAHGFAVLQAIKDLVNSKP